MKYRYMITSSCKAQQDNRHLKVFTLNSEEKKSCYFMIATIITLVDGSFQFETYQITLVDSSFQFETNQIKQDGPYV
uniref:Uncharacterized protein n=1 Tax=Arundo donax TaxID=35708 RepID=A0A0A8XX54_ARUDO